MMLKPLTEEIVMNYKIVVDSGCDLPKDLAKDKHFSIVPLTLIVDDYSIIDDDTFDQADFLERVHKSKNCPKSACPSPERYMNEFEEDHTDVYVITLSAELSGSYNSAQLGRNLYIEEGGTNNVYVFNSMSACCGEAIIAMKVQELVEKGFTFEEVIAKTEEYIQAVKTYFVLESLETLHKNGRLTNLQAIIASALNIKPLMSAESGKIIKLDQARGINKALLKMISLIKEKTVNSDDKILAISHCNCFERAEFVKSEIMKLMKCKDIIIVDTAGISSLYANEGGIIVTV
jgi:DegV family protein with EDD domain